MARMLVESLKRLYDSGKVTKEQIAERAANGVITWNEYEYITGEIYKNF